MLNQCLPRKYDSTYATVINPTQSIDRTSIVEHFYQNSSPTAVHPINRPEGITRTHRNLIVFNFFTVCFNSDLLINILRLTVNFGTLSFPLLYSVVVKYPLGAMTSQLESRDPSS